MESGSSTGSSEERRATRASNACFRCQTKKIRCDGKTPTCLPCKTQNIECAYGQLRRRGKGRKNLYIQSLEQRLDKMESLLRSSASRQEGIAATSNQSPDSSTLLDQPVINAVPVVVPGIHPLSNGEPTFTVHSTQQAVHKVLPNPTVSPERSRANNSVSTLLTSAEENFLTHFDKSKVQDLRDSVLQSKPGRLEFISMLPKTEALPLVESFLQGINKTFPLFHEQSLSAICRHNYPVDADSADPAWWACLNVIIAIEIHSRTSNSAFRTVSRMPWSFFKNALFVLPELMTDGPSILSVQALLAMAIFMSRATDLQTSALLTSSAIRMMQTIGLDRENLDNKLSTIEKEQRRRIFWIAYLLDGDTSLNLGLPPLLECESFNVNLPNEDSPDGLGKLFIPDVTGSVNIFRLRVELGILKSKIYKRLFSLNAAGVTPQYIQNQVLEFQYELEAWKGKIPAGIQPHHTSQARGETSELPVVMLQFEFNYCIDLIHSAAAVRHGSHELNQSRAFCIHAARTTLGLLDFVGCPSFVDLWRALPYPLCATITLLADVLASPASTHAVADVSLIDSFLQFLKNIQQQEGYDIDRFVAGCAVLDDVAKAAIARSQAEWHGQIGIEVGGDETQSPLDPVAGRTVQRLLSSLQKFPNYMQLAHGLMGNMPRLSDAACSVFSDIFSVFDKKGAPFHSFAPDSLMQSTYGFGSATSQATTGAVHTDADRCE